MCVCEREREREGERESGIERKSESVRDIYNRVRETRESWRVEGDIDRKERDKERDR